MNPTWFEIAARIHASGRQLVAATAAGGSGAISALVQTPGASHTVLEAIITYSAASLADWLGGQPAQAASSSTARAMAMQAFLRARRLAPNADPRSLVGVGCSASLATDRPKRGEHRVHVAWQTAEETCSHDLMLTKEGATRAAEEETSASLVLWSIAEACSVDASSIRASLPPLHTERVRGPAAAVELLLQSRRLAVVKPDSSDEAFDEAQTPGLPVVFPGAFNPPHAGHLRMAAEAERRLGWPAAWELSIANVDKPPLDFVALAARLAALRREDPQRPIVLTRAATFVEKAELFRGATFVVGADTLVRIAEPRYYGGDDRQRDLAISEIAGHGCRFLVFGRTVAGRFQSLGNLTLPAALRALCEEVPEAEFREDVSSTNLRQSPVG